MTREIQIKSIKLMLGKREIELSVEEAQNLKNALDKLFTREIVVERVGGWWFYPPIYQDTTISDPCTVTPEITWSGTTLCFANGEELS